MNLKSIGLLGLGLAATSYALWRRRPGVSIEGQVVAITGGSRGLGLTLARELGALGASLALIARDEEELEKAAEELRSSGYPVTTWTFDLFNTDEIPALVQNIVDYYGRLDVLINNAGEIVVGPFETLSRADFERSMSLHLMAPLEMIRAALPVMKAQGVGRIVNISSIGGKIPVPHLSSYCAGKFALTGLSSTLRAELAKDGIVVTTVCPGLMRTGSHWNAKFKGDQGKEFLWFSHGASLPLASMNAARAARQIVAAMRRGDAELLISLQAHAAVVGAALAPAMTAALETAVNQLLPGAPEHGDGKTKSGWESLQKQSLFTWFGDRAAAKNNELQGHVPPA
jgi:short-subunit dehydrogenase